MGMRDSFARRPSTWIPIPINRGLETCMESVRAVPMRESEEITGWFSAALFGLCLTTPVHRGPRPARRAPRGDT